MGHFRLCKHDYVLSGVSTNQTPRNTELTLTVSHYHNIYTVSAQFINGHLRCSFLRKCNFRLTKLELKVWYFLDSQHSVASNVMEWSRSLTRLHPKLEATPWWRWEVEVEVGETKTLHSSSSSDTFAWLLTTPACLPYSDKLHLFHSFYSNCGIGRSVFLPSSLMSLINNNWRI